MTRFSTDQFPLSFFRVFRVFRGCNMSQKTWGGRFSGETDNRVEAFTESISFDRRLYRHDVVASQAHARMLAEVRLLTADEANRIVAALDDIKGEIERGEFAFSIKLED